MADDYEVFTPRRIAAQAIDAIRKAEHDVHDGRYEEALTHRHEATMWSMLLGALVDGSPDRANWDYDLGLPTDANLRAAAAPVQ